MVKQTIIVLVYLGVALGACVGLADDASPNSVMALASARTPEVPAAPAPGPAPGRKPNLIVFLVDDVGYADIGTQGAQGFRTPHLDRMAAEGIRFTHFYVHPVCGVTRAALMTTTSPVGPKATDGGGPYPRSFRYTDTIGHEAGVTRRDPSDVIHLRNTFYLWYSKVSQGPGVFRYPSGYSAEVWYATSADGRSWVERGIAVGKGSESSWDDHGVFTPNILRFRGGYYLYYTGVPAGHGNTTPTHIGVAISESPHGPWRKCGRNPVLSPSEDPAKFDSMRVDDASLVVRDGKVFLYYKGRQQDHSSRETQMGVAMGRAPTGPFVKHGDGRPLHPGHEVMVWPHGTGVASMATLAGPRQVYFAADGFNFQPRGGITNAPRAPGAFRSDHLDEGAVGQGLRWGISHTGQGADRYLVRFDCQYASRDAPRSTPEH